MRLGRAAAVLAGILAVVFAHHASAQRGTITLEVSWATAGDCHKPFFMQGVRVAGTHKVVVATNKTVTSQSRIDTPLGSSELELSDVLGVTGAGVGGAARWKIAGRNRLVYVSDLPQNTMTMAVQIRGRSCSFSMDHKLKRGFTDYTFQQPGYAMYFYCSRPKLIESSCNVR